MELYFYKIEKTIPGGIPEIVSSFVADCTSAIDRLLDLYELFDPNVARQLVNGRLVVTTLIEPILCLFDDGDSCDNLEKTIGNPCELIYTLRRDPKFVSTPLTLKTDLEYFKFLEIEVIPPFPEPPSIMEPEKEKPSPLETAKSIIETFITWEAPIIAQLKPSQSSWISDLFKEAKDFLHEQNKNPNKEE